MRRAFALFDKVVDLPDDRLEDALRELAGGDAGLIEATLQLIRADRNHDGNLDLLGIVDKGPRGESTHPQTWDQNAGYKSSESAADTIGHFVIQGVLGQGGMGTVYLAKQVKPVHRVVALKVIRATITAASALARFDLEREAMARLSHANVAKIYEGGTTDDGMPWFAMEHIDGPPITSYCDQKRLPITDRLSIFISMCRGVEHAHQRSILHRDLKPSNVLVAEEDGLAVPKVIDFGIAKAVDSPLAAHLTGSGMIGTPAYMSPESMTAQMAGDVDTRHDVYALGILLYELLAGTRPFEPVEANIMRLIASVVNKEPPAMSTQLGQTTASSAAEIGANRQIAKGELRRRLEGDLDSIVNKAIARDRQDRYGSAAELATDVQRYLDDEPVLAVPPSRGYRAVKFVRRNRAFVGAASAVGVAMVLGIIGTSVGLVRANREAVQAHRQAERADREAAAAAEVTDFLIEMFEVHSPSESRGRTITAQQILTPGTRRVGDLENPKLQARLRDTLGRLHDQVGLHEDAELLLGDSVMQYRELGDEFGLAESLLHLGDALIHRSKLEEARDAHTESLAIRRRILGPDHVDIAQSLGALGMAESWLADFPTSIALLEASLAILNKHLPPTDERVLWTREQIAGITGNMGDYSVAEQGHREVLALRLETLGADHPDVAESYDHLSLVLWNRGEHAEAEQASLKAIAIAENALGPAHPRTLMMRSQLALVLQAQGRLDEAEVLYRRTLERQIEAIGARHAHTARTQLNLAALLIRQKRYDEAEVLARDSLAVGREVLSKNSFQLSWTIGTLGKLLRRTGELDEAEPLYREALQMKRVSLGDGHIGTAIAAHDLATLLVQSGRTDEAIPLLEEAVAIADASDGDPKNLTRFQKSLDAAR